MDQIRKKIFIYLFMAVLGLHCRMGFSLLVVSGGLLSSWGAQASHYSGFSCCGAQGLGCVGSVVVAHRLSRSVACGIFLEQGLNLCLLHWQVHSLPLSH